MDGFTHEESLSDWNMGCHIALHGQHALILKIVQNKILLLSGNMLGYCIIH